MSLKLASRAFSDGQPIPVKYTCDGEGVSPPLSWTDAPHATKSLALIMDDPDAPMGLFTHWLLYDVPTNVTELNEGLPPTETLPNGARQGRNGFRKIGYGGPCPPSGTHRYFFHLYALDTDMRLPSGAARQTLEAALKGHVLEQTELMGTYQRRK